MSNRVNKDGRKSKSRNKATTIIGVMIEVRFLKISVLENPISATPRDIQSVVIVIALPAREIEFSIDCIGDLPLSLAVLYLLSTCTESSTTKPMLIAKSINT